MWFALIQVFFTVSKRPHYGGVRNHIGRGRYTGQEHAEQYSAQQQRALCRTIDLPGAVHEFVYSLRCLSCCKNYSAKFLVLKERLQLNIGISGIFFGTKIDAPLLLPHYSRYKIGGEAQVSTRGISIPLSENSARYQEACMLSLMLMRSCEVYRFLCISSSLNSTIAVANAMAQSASSLTREAPVDVESQP